MLVAEAVRKLDKTKRKTLIFLVNISTSLVCVRKAKILLSFGGICLVFILFSGLSGVQHAVFLEDKVCVEDACSVLSKDERKDLEALFEHFFFFDQFSYPLFGSKPMSVGRLLPTKEYRNGWQAWKKIAPQFDSGKFVIRESMFNGHEVVFIANLDAVERAYHQNRGLFEEAFGGRMSLDALKECIARENSLFQELIKNDVCLGVLLGYGAENARLFANGAERNRLKPFSKGHPIFYYFSSVMPVYFACDLNSEETKELRARYKTERAAILKKENLFTSMLVALHGDSE
jgi:hypothetical protein